MKKHGPEKTPYSDIFQIRNYSENSVFIPNTDIIFLFIPFLHNGNGFKSVQAVIILGKYLSILKIRSLGDVAFLYAEKHQLNPQSCIGLPLFNIDLMQYFTLKTKSLQLGNLFRQNFFINVPRCLKVIFLFLGLLGGEPK